jgi:hypothetical protein
MADVRYAFRILLGKAEGERPLGKVTRVWNDNIKNGRLKVFAVFGFCEHGC